LHKLALDVSSQDIMAVLGIIFNLKDMALQMTLRNTTPPKEKRTPSQLYV